MMIPNHLNLKPPLPLFIRHRNNAGAVPVIDLHRPASKGSVVVGSGSFVGSGAEAFRWTAGGGMRSVQDPLATDLVLDLTGWQLMQAHGVSADGLTIVGYGTNPCGKTEAWTATLPEPGSVALPGLGGVALLRKRGV